MSLSRLLLFASLTQEYYYYLLTASLLGRDDSTERNSILSVKKNIINTHIYVHYVCARIFKSIYYSFRHREDIHTCAHTSDLTKCILFFPLTRKKRRFFLRKFASFSHSGVLLTYLPCERDRQRLERESESEKDIPHIYTRWCAIFSFFSLQRRYMRALSEHISPKRFLLVFPQLCVY